jgi:hypothetical protein
VLGFLKLKENEDPLERWLLAALTPLTCRVNRPADLLGNEGRIDLAAAFTPLIPQGY